MVTKKMIKERLIKYGNEWAILVDYINTKNGEVIGKRHIRTLGDMRYWNKQEAIDCAFNLLNKFEPETTVLSL